MQIDYKIDIFDAMTPSLIQSRSQTVADKVFSNASGAAIPGEILTCYKPLGDCHEMFANKGVVVASPVVIKAAKAYGSVLARQNPVEASSEGGAASIESSGVP
ncbi:hypothetical protein [Hoeflea sp. IMCC20628]|uniref:hypothetical protein n=1 Tax=Hoeflea sp. IMCC20628 TaxID=1620421 RepID=UPI00063AB6AF|nr:hypothetical protein [Hoeflea sp. IMCC20628]